MENPFKSASGLVRAIPLTGNRHPDGSSKQLHTIQKPSVSKSSAPRVKMNSVRFDPHVTDIYDSSRPINNPHYSHSRPSYNSDVQINPNPRSSQRSSNNPLPLQQQVRQKQWLEDPLSPQKRPSQRDKVHPLYSDICHQHQRPRSEPQQLLITKGNTKPQPPSPRHLLSLSHASSLNDDESDLNTTTSGSYSVASDDVGRISSLLEVNDLYV